MAAQRAPPVQIPKRSSGDTVQPKTQLGTDNQDSKSVFPKPGEKSGLKPHDISLRFCCGSQRRSASPYFAEMEFVYENPALSIAHVRIDHVHTSHPKIIP